MKENIRVYNTEGCLIWEGNETDYMKLCSEGLIKTTDKIVC